MQRKKPQRHVQYTPRLPWFIRWHPSDRVVMLLCVVSVITIYTINNT